MWSRLSALLGAALFAAGGVTMPSMNAGWFGLERDANSLFPLLGVGAGLVVVVPVLLFLNAATAPMLACRPHHRAESRGC